MLTSVSSLAVSAGAYREVQTYRYGAGAVRTRMRSNKIVLTGLWRNWIERRVMSGGVVPWR